MTHFDSTDLTPSPAGAVLGRVAALDAPPTLSALLKLRRVALDAEGFDVCGMRYGHVRGVQLYWCGYLDEDAGHVGDWLFRAVDRDHAKRLVRYRFPHARFYR